MEAKAQLEKIHSEIRHLLATLLSQTTEQPCTLKIILTCGANNTSQGCLKLNQPSPFGKGDYQRNHWI